MRKVKWIFFAYLALVTLVICGIAVSFAVVPKRNPNTLYVAYAANIKTLDPGNIADVPGAGVAGQVFECLYNYEYQTRPYKLMCELATEMPKISPDGLVWTIPVRKGVHYYDPEKKVWPDGIGPEVKAQDFVFAWKRMSDFHQASQNYSAIFESRIEGLDDWRTYTQKTPAADIDWDRPVSGWQTPDDHTIVIRLTQPTPQLIYNLAHLPTAPMSREAVKYWGSNTKHHPIGTGPYVIAEHLPEQRIVFEANPIYRGGSDVDPGADLPPDKKLPHIKRVQMDYFDENLPAWALFQQGLLDVAGIPKDVFGQAISVQTGALTPEMQKKGIVLRKDPDPDIWFYGFNMKDPVVGKNKPLRQAMSMALNRKEYIDLFLNGRGTPAIGPIPPGFETFDPDQVNPYTQFNLEGARKKLKEAEAIQGGPIPRIKLLMPGTDTTFRQMGEYMQKTMAQIGIGLDVDYTTWARFQEMVDNKQAQFYALGWQADYPDEQTFLQLFWSKNASPGPNSANYSNPEYDKLYERAIVLPDGPERRDLYRKMEAMAIEDTPWLMTFYSVAYSLRYDWVGNLSDNTYAHGNRKYITLDVADRSRRLGHAAPPTLAAGNGER